MFRKHPPQRPTSKTRASRQLTGDDHATEQDKVSSLSYNGDRAINNHDRSCVSVRVADNSHRTLPASRPNNPAPLDAVPPAVVGVARYDSCIDSVPILCLFDRSNIYRNHP